MRRGVRRRRSSGPGTFAATINGSVDYAGRRRDRLEAAVGVAVCGHGIDRDLCGCARGRARGRPGGNGASQVFHSITRPASSGRRTQRTRGGQGVREWRGLPSNWRVSGDPDGLGFRRGVVASRGGQAEHRYADRPGAVRRLQPCQHGDDHWLGAQTCRCARPRRSRSSGGGPRSTGVVCEQQPRPPPTVGCQAAVRNWNLRLFRRDEGPARSPVATRCQHRSRTRLTSARGEVGSASREETSASDSEGGGSRASPAASVSGSPPEQGLQQAERACIWAGVL